MDRRTRVLFLIGLVVSMVIAVGLSQFASSAPDGLEYVAEQEGFSEAAVDHDLSGSPLADYGAEFTDSGVLGTAIAGFVGVIATLALGWVVFRMIRRRDPSAMG